jgi:hypothetical protein
MDLVAPSMAELKEREIEGDKSQPGELKAVVNHWLEVIDDWVERLDEGMGGTAPTGADPEVAGGPPDPPPGDGARSRAGVPDGMTA